MAKYRKKPVVIEAIQFGASGNATEAFEWAKERRGDRQVTLQQDRDQGWHILISTLEGVMQADIDDWIICGVAGELYPCKPDIFEATYEPAARPTRTRRRDEP